MIDELLADTEPATRERITAAYPNYRSPLPAYSWAVISHSTPRPGRSPKPRSARSHVPLSL
ncbi:carboxylesterase domain protein [Mycobacterium ulcerans str. Harvey]|uniref:Carboxylesterase domain protein n=1 Tax=Mycobacterium ulcerans str. Harvey TaxID=1299332 RepID=A0ABP3AGZ3_MYCUL|nr:carboxylesterase domain protein [Mycobacterium ulcerans str. Harvey]